MISDKTIGRLSLYRRLLNGLEQSGQATVFSHEVASMAGVTAAQVRRDVMSIGFSGSPAKGYGVSELAEAISTVLYRGTTQTGALIGVGNLGRALLAYFVGRHPKLSIRAAFDRDPAKTNRVINGCRCYPNNQLAEVVRTEGIQVGVITVPAGEAQSAANDLCQAGILGLLNFAPVRLWVPAHVYVEDLDVSQSLERVAYFAGQRAADKEVTK